MPGAFWKIWRRCSPKTRITGAAGHGTGGIGNDNKHCKRKKSLSRPNDPLALLGARADLIPAQTTQTSGLSA